MRQYFEPDGSPRRLDNRTDEGSLRFDGVVLLRRLHIDFRRVAEESGLVRGKLCRSPHFGWGVQNSYGDPGPDFGCITPPAFEPGETELRIDCSEWWFLGPVAPAHQQENIYAAWSALCQAPGSSS